MASMSTPVVPGGETLEVVELYRHHWAVDMGVRARGVMCWPCQSFISWRLDLYPSPLIFYTDIDIAVLLTIMRVSELKLIDNSEEKRVF